MPVARTATVVAAALVALSVITFVVSESRSATALIPAAVGLAVGALVLLARRAGGAGRGIVLGWAVLGALAALGSLSRVVPALLDGVELPVAFAAQVATVVLGAWLAVAAVRALTGTRDRAPGVR